MLASSGFQADIRALQKNLDARHQVDVSDPRVVQILVVCSVKLRAKTFPFLECRFTSTNIANR